MGLFTHKSKWDVVSETIGAAAGSGGVRTAMKVGAGVAAGLFGISALSAAISSARSQE